MHEMRLEHGLWPTGPGFIPLRSMRAWRFGLSAPTCCGQHFSGLGYKYLIALQMAAIAGFVSNTVFDAIFVSERKRISSNNLLKTINTAALAYFVLFVVK
jgi:hypothetical protein